MGSPKAVPVPCSSWIWMSKGLMPASLREARMHSCGSPRLLKEALKGARSPAAKARGVQLSSRSDRPRDFSIWKTWQLKGTWLRQVPQRIANLAGVEQCVLKRLLVATSLL